ncbi:MAG: SH3 domain-containing protein [Pseudomonadota bacterium]
MFNLSYLVVGAVAIGLVTTMVLAAWLTPSRWWRQLNVRALAIVGLGTWGIASLVLWLAQSTAPAHAITPLAAFVPDAGRSYRVHEDLNLRYEKGTAAKRIAVVPAGTVVTTTGARDGDWWQVSARVGGKEVRGWSSSLWLRRADERAL